MKLLSLCLLAGLLMFLSGCASESAGYYTPSQVYAQHAQYDPNSNINGNR